MNMKVGNIRNHIEYLIKNNLDLIKIYTVYKNEYSQNPNTIKYYDSLIYESKKNIVALKYCIKCIDYVQNFGG